jgi:hypothetical protein
MKTGRMSRFAVYTSEQINRAAPPSLSDEHMKSVKGSLTIRAASTSSMFVSLRNCARRFCDPARRLFTTTRAKSLASAPVFSIHFRAFAAYRSMNTEPDPFVTPSGNGSSRSTAFANAPKEIALSPCESFSTPTTSAVSDCPEATESHARFNAELPEARAFSMLYIGLPSSPVLRSEDCARRHCQLAGLRRC